MNNKRDKNEIRDMVEDELLELSKVMDVSESMRKFDELKYPLPKHYNTADITGVPKKGRESLYQYLTVYKSAKKGQQSFRLTSQLLRSVYKKANSLKKEGLIIITIPADSKNKFRVECIVKKENK